MLPQAPDYVLDPHGVPRYGAYEGFAHSVDWRALAGPARRLLRHKRWQWCSIGGAECLVSVAIIDLGWVTSAFAYVFDRRERRLLADLSWTGRPGASKVTETPGGDGARSRFSGGGAELVIERPGAAPRWRVHVRAKGMSVDADLDGAGAPPTLCAIAHPPNARANCTHKTVGLVARGSAEAGGKRFTVDGYSGAMDHTSGLLARDTRWRWANASRAGLGFNLVEGFNGAVENALWVGDKLIPVGAATIEYDAAAPDAPWRVRTEDGCVDLEFRPEGRRAKHQDLVIAASRYVQPVGTFHGTVRPGVGAAAVEVKDLLGVTEDHAARW